MDTTHDSFRRNLVCAEAITCTNHAFENYVNLSFVPYIDINCRCAAVYFGVRKPNLKKFCLCTCNNLQTGFITEGSTRFMAEVCTV